MIEWLCILLVMGFIAHKLQPHRLQKARRRPEPPAPPIESRLRLEMPDEPDWDAEAQGRLDIGDTEPLPARTHGLVARFGIDPSKVLALRALAGPRRHGEFPLRLAALIGELHDTGCALGGEIMELAHHGRELRADEAVFFALVDAGRGERVLAFIERLRARSA
jgi:hypothetical protein